MLQTRLWMGGILIVLTAGMLIVDRWLAPWFPFLFLVVVGLVLGGCFELVRMLSGIARPRLWLCFFGLLGIISANWFVHVPPAEILKWDPWIFVLGAFAAMVVVSLVVEMILFGLPGQPAAGRGEIILSAAVTVWIGAYLGILPSFLVQLRWLKDGDYDFGATAVALTIFVPKCCDIGAYLIGRLIGRNKMAPVLSPGKTWEGAVGGILAGVVTAIAINRLAPTPVLGTNLEDEVTFGLLLSLVGMFGDLAESLIKRDSGQKDASQAVPGFGGVLDVIDSLIFAGPVAYLWFSTNM